MNSKKESTDKCKNNNEKSLKWAVIAALRHEDIAKDLQRISKLGRYEDQYN